MKTPAPQSPFSKAAGLKVATLLKKRLTCQKCFPVNCKNRTPPSFYFSKLLYYILKAASKNLEAAIRGVL